MAVLLPGITDFGFAESQTMALELDSRAPPPPISL